MEFQLQHCPSNEYSGLISFRIEWFELLAVQGTLKSLLQHHSSKASILWGSAFFIVQLSHPYMTTGKTIPLTRWTFTSLLKTLYINCLIFHCRYNLKKKNKLYPANYGIMSSQPSPYLIPKSGLCIPPIYHSLC